MLKFDNIRRELLYIPVWAKDISRISRLVWKELILFLIQLDQSASMQYLKQIKYVCAYSQIALIKRRITNVKT